MGNDATFSSDYIREIGWSIMLLNMNFSLFEIGMLFCFGCAWPVNIYKSLRSKTAKGKSVVFLYILFVGYLFGIVHKILFSPDIVMILYIINSSMVAVDIILYHINAARDKRAT